MRNPVDATLMGPPRRFTSDRFRHGFVVCVSVCTVGAAGASHARGPLVVWSLVCRSVGALVIVLSPCWVRWLVVHLGTPCAINACMRLRAGIGARRLRRGRSRLELVQARTCP